MRGVSALLLRDALDSIYARAMTQFVLVALQSCTAGLHFGHKLNASALQALACHRCTLFGGV